MVGLLRKAILKILRKKVVLAYFKELTADVLQDGEINHDRYRASRHWPGFELRTHGMQAKSMTAALTCSLTWHKSFIT
jgi:hypothetical protein